MDPHRERLAVFNALDAKLKSGERELAPLLKGAPPNANTKGKLVLARVCIVNGVLDAVIALGRGVPETATLRAMAKEAMPTTAEGFQDYARRARAAVARAVGEIKKVQLPGAVLADARALHVALNERFGMLLARGTVASDRDIAGAEKFLKEAELAFAQAARELGHHDPLGALCALNEQRFAGLLRDKPTNYIGFGGMQVTFFSWDANGRLAAAES